ncbi:hypothetical protein FSP39_009526 [Pinctada imbricata]|uniref:Uncharacterized protein n=1 Tax=Pinctada imbricata TaxID=66713 RepID=A0AA89BUF2_PINIB|nr:hypothetical protein FSP39_009526 [Pinctada imbricata]
MTSQRKRVLIVGAGAAGTAAGYSLTRCADMFDVELWEKGRAPGGVACTSTIKGGLDINDGVQGGTPTYRNTLSLMNEFGFKTSPVHMMISFGKSQYAWTNYSKSELTAKLRDDIRRFQTVLKILNKLEAIFIFLPIGKVLKFFRFSDDFCNHMVYPLTALFFGTGNQTPYVSSAIVARVFLDDDLRLFDYDSEQLLSQTPEMFAFPKLEDMYTTILKKSGIKYFPNRALAKVERKNDCVIVTDEHGKTQTFDELIYACDAETPLRAMKPTFLEKAALGNVRYFNDLIITHEDDEYMERHYELHKEKDQYFIRTDPKDPVKIEMSFNLSNYQPHLRNSGRNIYQTIYLDDKLKDIWTDQDLNEDKVLLRRWWRQFAHSWHHYAFTVPLMRYLQGKKHTWYAGAYTLINTHEIAVISGFAVAHRLGAPYPFPNDRLAAKQFDQYLLMIHGQPRTYGVNKGTILSYILAPFMALFAVFSMILRVFFN